MALSRSQWHPLATPPTPPHPSAAANPGTAEPDSLLQQSPRGQLPACRERLAPPLSIPPFAVLTATSPGVVTRRVVSVVSPWAKPSRVHEWHKSLSRPDKYSTGYPDSLGLGFPATVAFYSGSLPASAVPDRSYTALLMRSAAAKARHAWAIRRPE